VYVCVCVYVCVFVCLSVCVESKYAPFLPSLLLPIRPLSFLCLLARACAISLCIFRLSEVLVQYDQFDNVQDPQSNGVSLSLPLSLSMFYAVLLSLSLAYS